jgi:hypothetical protein
VSDSNNEHPFLGLATRHTAAGLAGQVIADAISLTVAERVELGVYRALEKRDGEAKLNRARAQRQIDALTMRACDFLIAEVGPHLADFIFRPSRRRGRA